jgi:hypothetical protein
MGNWGLGFGDWGWRLGFGKNFQLLYFHVAQASVPYSEFQEAA